MLSKKMTVSLMSLITIFALVFVVSPVMANEIKLRVTDANHAGPGEPDDVSVEDGIQVLAGTHVTVTLTSAEPINGASIDIKRISPINNVNEDFEIDGAWVAATPETPGTIGIVRVNASKYTIYFTEDTQSPMTADSEVTLWVVPGAFQSVTTGDNDSTGAMIKFKYVAADHDGTATDAPVGEDQPNDPTVVSITRATAIGSTIASAFIEEVVSGDFMVKIVLTEKPNGGLHADKVADRIKAISASAATVTNVVVGTTIDRGTEKDNPLPESEGGYDADATPADPIPDPTGRDMKYYTYLATISPSGAKDTVVIQVNDFKDLVKTQGEGTDIVEPGEYRKPSEKAAKNTREKLEVKVEKSPAGPKEVGLKIAIPNDIIVPAGGYLILGRDDGSGDDNHEKRTDSTQIIYPGDPTVTPILASDRQPNQQKYNLIKAALPNLEVFLSNGGTIDVMSTGLTVSEIMWGTDASLGTPSHNQWIELYNAGAEYKTKDAALIFYAPNDAVPAKTAAVAATATTAAVPAMLPAGVSDRVGTIDDAGAYWSIAGKGQSGRTGQGETAGELIAVVPTQSVISMYRVMMADTSVGAAAGAMMPAYGNMASAWMQSTPPAVNFSPTAIGVRIGSPGADRLITAAEATATAAAEAAKAAAAAAAAAKSADTSVMMPKVGQIYISEIMFAGGGTLPQWIEISNGSRTEMVNLSGWTITVDNAATDADVSVGASIKFMIPEGTKVHPSGQSDYPSTLLVVTETGRNNLSGPMAAGQVLNLWKTQQTELILGGVTKRRYSLLSSDAFQITLAPPVPIVAPAAATPAPTTAAEIAAKRAADAAKKAAAATEALERAAVTDVVGNLGDDGSAKWALSMSEDGGRSSIIRTHTPVSVGPAEPNPGTMMDSWVLASETAFKDIQHIKAQSYYGAANDMGTPGFRTGGALPVELSHFRPARDKATGAVVITWSTQSELNNAGFFIKRSQQRDGEFTIINAAMVPGAGTTSEKQFYTYTDTTAQPNVVYYYQIEDVSLDGNRQALTRGIRLKGHVSVAGKFTSTWGELKTSNE